MSMLLLIVRVCVLLYMLPAIMLFLAFEFIYLAVEDFASAWLGFRGWPPVIHPCHLRHRWVWAGGVATTVWAGLAALVL